MPKVKTKRAAAKRFSKTGTGKIKRGAAFRRHILTKKTTKVKRHLRGAQLVHESNVGQIERLIPYK
jgi:large subunit ribosomal protein L35